MSDSTTKSSLFSNDFVNQIKQDRDDGFGFIPLLGAGISAPAGVPIIREISAYLNRAICIALGLDEDRNTFWNPRLHEWPRFKDVIEMGIDWADKVIDAHQKIKNQDSPPPHLEFSGWVVQEAIGAMADWRSSLQFLSRITRSTQGQYALNSPDPEVVDRFFLRVIHDGYSPSLAHRTLVALTRLLRVEAILTTNFDDLVEAAFRQKGEDITSFDVHLNSGLPPYDVLQSSLSIVKLHGGRYGLRADYSLDSQPKEADRKTLLSYIAGKRLPTDYELNLERHNLVPQNQLIVIGLSGDDTRIASLLQTAFMHFDETFRIYWLSYSETDKRKAESLIERTKNQYSADGSNAVDPADTFVIEKNHHTGFYLQELYQQLALGLPTINHFYPSVAQLFVPVQCLTTKSEEQDESANHKNAIKTFSNKIDKTIAKPNGRIVVASSKKDVYGITAIASEQFSKLEDNYYHCIWIDLDEISNTEELTEVILDSFARRAGVDEWIPVVHEKEPHGRVKEINRYTTKSQKKWILFLNGRDGAGSSANNLGSSPNGWLDEEDEAKKFVQILNDLSGVTCPNVAVVLLCFEGPILEAINDKTSAHHFRLTTASQVKAPAELVADGYQWVTRTDSDASQDADTDQITSRGRFLLALTLMNRSRYLSLTWSWAFHGGKIVEELQLPLPISERRFERSKEWLSFLETHEIIYRKPGGFIWMDTDVRDGLQKMLLQREDLKHQQADILHGIAEWLQKAFFSSRDPLAAVDTTYYRLANAISCLRTCCDLRKSKTLFGKKLSPKKIDIETVKHLTRCKNSLLDAAFLLNTAKNEMLRSGYSKSTCRQLVHLRKIMMTDIRDQILLARDTVNENAETLINLVDQIWEQNNFLIELSLRLNRSIAHEVAELETAFRRHRQWRKFREDQKIETDPRKFKPEKNLNIYDLVEWHGNMGTFFIAIRSYRHSRSSLRLLFNRLGFPIKLIDWPNQKETLRNDAYDLIKTIAAWAREIRLQKPDMSDTIFNSTVNGLARNMQLYLVRGQGFHLVSRRKTQYEQAKFKEKMHLVYLKADCCYRAAEEIGRHIEEGRIQRHLGDRKNIAICHAWLHEKQRLLTQFSLVRSVLRDFAEAIRRLEEAEAILDTMEYGHESLERGILNLHRAEVLTQQSMFRPGVWPEQMTEIGEFRQGLLNIHAKRGADLRIVYHQEWGDFGEIRKNIIFVKDALREVAKASKSLQKHRKNVWWVTWMFEIKLKAIELEVFASLSDLGNKSLAYLGTLSAPEHSLSECDRILEDSLRMIRLDVFRFSRILESYARCLMCVKAKRLIIQSQLEAFSWMKRRHLLFERSNQTAELISDTVQNLESQSNAKSAKLNDVRSVLNEKLKETSEAIALTAKTIRFEIETKSKTLNELDDQLKNLRNRIAVETDQLKDHEKTLKQHQSKRDRLQKQIEKLGRGKKDQLQLKTKTSLLLEIKDEIELCKERFENETDLINELKNELAECEGRNVELNYELSKLGTEMKTQEDFAKAISPENINSVLTGRSKTWKNVAESLEVVISKIYRIQSKVSKPNKSEVDTSTHLPDLVNSLTDRQKTLIAFGTIKSSLPDILLHETELSQEERSLEARQLSMHELCQGAHAELQNKLELKKQLGSNNRKTNLEKEVAEYVNHVITETSEILDFTANWNGQA